MLEARIASPKGSLYYAAEATPYDLEMLRLHVRELTPRNGSGLLTLEVIVDESDPAAAVIAEWLGTMAAAGVNVAATRVGVPDVAPESRETTPARTAPAPARVVVSQKLVRRPHARVTPTRQRAALAR